MQSNSPWSEIDLWRLGAVMQQIIFPNNVFTLDEKFLKKLRFDDCIRRILSDDVSYHRSGKIIEIFQKIQKLLKEKRSEEINQTFFLQNGFSNDEFVKIMICSVKN